MSSIYSKRFGQGFGLTGQTNFGPVPAGKIWVVRDIDIYTNSGGSASTVFAQLAIIGTGYSAFFVGKIAAFSQDSVQWRGRQVFNAGEYIGINPSGATIDCLISGYELTL